MSEANAKSNPRSFRFVSLLASSHAKRTVDYTPVYTPQAINWPIPKDAPRLGILRQDTSTGFSDAHQRRYDRSGPYGVSDKFRSVEDDHDVAMGQLFISSAFVLGQAAITEAISIATRVRELAGGPPTLPYRKPAIMATEAPLHTESGLSKIAIVDAVANYFKHRYEWYEDWSGPERAKDSIALVTRLGFEPRCEYNLSRALGHLEMSDSDLSPIAHLIQEWRERLATYYRNALNEPSSWGSE